MIISKQKPFSDILSSIKNHSVFLVGCSECATMCHVGGEKEVIEMKMKLEQHDVSVNGWVVLDPACHLLNDNKMLKPFLDQISQSDMIVVLACGNGVQTIAELFDEKVVLSGTDTMFLGEIKRLNKFERRCNLCGTCVVDSFHGLCPITRCPKHMQNGPCGGSHDGKCEVNKHISCVWVDILSKKKSGSRNDSSFDIVPPHDWSKSIVMCNEGGRKK